MITPEEEQRIIDKAVEKALLTLPVVMSNLMRQQAEYTKQNSEFYAKYPEFRDHKRLVQRVVEKVDGENPALSYPEKLAKAVPIIKEQIAKVDVLDRETINKAPNRRFEGEFGLLETQKINDSGEI